MIDTPYHPLRPGQIWRTTAAGCLEHARAIDRISDDGAVSFMLRDLPGSPILPHVGCVTVSGAAWDQWISDFHAEPIAEDDMRHPPDKEIRILVPCTIYDER